MTQNDSAVWSLDGSHGELLIRTGVAGRAAQMGHRLTIAMRSWQATTQWEPYFCLGDDKDTFTFNHVSEGEPEARNQVATGTAAAAFTTTRSISRRR